MHTCISTMSCIIILHMPIGTYMSHYNIHACKIHTHVTCCFMERIAGRICIYVCRCCHGCLHSLWTERLIKCIMIGRAGLILVYVHQYDYIGGINPARPIIIQLKCGVHNLVTYSIHVSDEVAPVHNCASCAT